MLYLYHVNTFSYVELKDNFIIGRSTGDLVIPDSGLSGKHAQLMVDQVDGKRALVVMDLGSKNRTALNRAELIPNQKYPVDSNSYLELGGQAFIITDRKTMSIGEINEIVEHYCSKDTIKLEGVKLVHDLKEKMKGEVSRLVDTETCMNQGISELEAQLTKVQTDMSQLSLNLERELKKLDEAKVRLMEQAKAKKEELVKKAAETKLQIEAHKAQIEKIRQDVELKKKKIINLKAVAGD